MEYGINIRFIEKLVGMETAAKMIAEAGFTKLDYTPALLPDTWREKMMGDLEIFEGNNKYFGKDTYINII